MTPATKHLIEMFERMKKQNQDLLDRVEKMPGFRMVQYTNNGEVDKTEQYKQDIRNGIDEWQRAIDYLTQHNLRGGPAFLDSFRGRDKCNSIGYAATASS